MLRMPQTNSFFLITCLGKTAWYAALCFHRNEVCHADVSAAAIRFEGQVLLVDPAQQPPAGTCQTAGVIGPLLGVMGSMQALEAIKYLTGIPSGLAGKLKLFDAKSLEWQSLQLNSDPHCIVCGSDRGA